MKAQPEPLISETFGHLTLTSASAAETACLGARLAPLLRLGDVLPLWGGFGVGKTTFVQGVARGLGVEPPVVSPSFGLVNEYAPPACGSLRLYHLDLYRIGSLEEAEAFGVEELLDGDGALLIEWPEVIRAALPSQRLDVTLELVDEDCRAIHFEAIGGRFVQLLDAYSRLAGGR